MFKSRIYAHLGNQMKQRTTFNAKFRLETSEKKEKKKKGRI